VKIHGEWVPVRAEVANLDGMSAHADRNGLLAWIAALPRPPGHVYVTHGEPVAADALRQAIEERHRWACSVPEYLERVDVQAFATSTQTSTSLLAPLPDALDGAVDGALDGALHGA
jgi:hypothetical protein